MAKYDHAPGCGCGLYAECQPDCEWTLVNVKKAASIKNMQAEILAKAPALIVSASRWKSALNRISAVAKTEGGAMDQILAIARDALSAR